MGTNWQHLSPTSNPITQRTSWRIWDHCWSQPGWESAAASCCAEGSCQGAVFQQLDQPLTPGTWEVIPSLNTATDPSCSTFSWVRFRIFFFFKKWLVWKAGWTQSRNPGLAIRIGWTRLFSLNNKHLLERGHESNYRRNSSREDRNNLCIIERTWHNGLKLQQSIPVRHQETFITIRIIKH